MNKTFIYWTLLGISLCVSSCESHHNPQKTTDKDSLSTIDQIDELKGTDCDIKLGNVIFTKAVNGADTLVRIKDNGILEFRCGGKRDFFCDPNDGKLSNKTAPLLLTKVDNMLRICLFLLMTRYGRSLHSSKMSEVNTGLSLCVREEPRMIIIMKK